MTVTSLPDMPVKVSTAYVIATGHYALEQLWGMSLVERVLRQLSGIGINRAILVCDKHLNTEDFLRPDFSEWTEIHVETQMFEQREGKPPMRPYPGRAIVVDARVVVDTRILEHLRDSSLDARFDVKQWFVGVTTYDAFFDPGMKRVHEPDLCTYIQSTRKQVKVFAIPVNSEEDLRFAEKTTFASIYKGATDFVTKFVFYLPARSTVRLISPTRITPNQVTMASMVLSFGAIVPFFTGQYWTAVIMGFAMAFLDTVDGKLARATFRTSKSGDLLDHVSDFVYLLAWFIGLGWSLSGGHLFDPANPVAQIHAVLIAAFLADKILTGLYKRLYGYQLHDYTKLDYSVRIFIARRNPFLLCMLISLLIGDPVIGLIMTAAWYVLTLGFHLVRFIYLPMSGEKHQYESS